jgi:hypothetical protein
MGYAFIAEYPTLIMPFYHFLGVTEARRYVVKTKPLAGEIMNVRMT